MIDFNTWIISFESRCECGQQSAVSSQQIGHSVSKLSLCFFFFVLKQFIQITGYRSVFSIRCSLHSIWLSKFILLLFPYLGSNMSFINHYMYMFGSAHSKNHHRNTYQNIPHQMGWKCWSGKIREQQRCRKKKFKVPQKHFECFQSESKCAASHIL